jgi:hypothetical protein
MNISSRAASSFRSSTAYQLCYSRDQLQRSYPQINDFFAAKRKYDPAELFTNTFYQKYAS